VLTPIVTRFGDFVDKLNTFAEANPKIVQIGAGLLTLASGALIAGGAINVINAGFMGLRLVAPFLTKALGPVGLAMMALGLVIDHWDDIMKTVRANSPILIHAGAEIVRLMDKLGDAFNGLGKFVVDLMGKIGAVLSSNPLMKGLGDSLQTAWQNMTKVSPQQQAADERFLNAHKLGGMVQTLKGSPGVMAGQANMGGTMNGIMQAINDNKKAIQAQPKPIINNTYHVAMTVNGAPGQSPKQIADEVHKQLADGLAHAASAKGNHHGVVRSAIAFGAAQ
jgi:hypothetical protein